MLEILEIQLKVIAEWTTFWAVGSFYSSQLLTLLLSLLLYY